MTLKIEAALTPTSILASAQIQCDNYADKRDRAARFRDEDAEAYWAGCFDAFNGLRKTLAAYWAANGDLAATDG